MERDRCYYKLKMNHSGALVKSGLVLFLSTTLLFIVSEDLIVTGFAKDYPSVFRTWNSSHDNTPFSPLKFGVNFTLHNTTGMISLVGSVNVNELTVDKFKPFVFAGSTASFLTKDYAAYEAAKNASETLRPTTQVFQVHPLSSFNEQTDPSHLSVTFEGLQQNCCVPSDVQLAAGPNYVMEMVNLDGAIYTKSGSAVKEFGLERFFNPPSLSPASDSMSDPVLTYDSQSGRWIASISDTTEHSIRVAVSRTADPTGIWKVYDFPFGSQFDNCSDQPFIGVSKDKIVITVNNWANNCNWYSNNRPPEFGGVQFTVVNKSNLVAGSNSVESVQSESDLNYFSFHPVAILSPVSLLLITSVGNFDHNNLQVLYVDGPVSNLYVRHVSFSIQTSHVPPDGIQPTARPYPSSVSALQTGQSEVGTGDSRVQSAVWYHGILWLAFNDACFVNNDSKSRSCIRFMQLNTNTSNIIQDFDVAAFASSLYYPALSADKSGNLGIIFGYSSHSRNPSLLISKHLFTDPPDSIEPPHILKLGTANELSDRYGDYFAASPDPSDRSAVWIAGQYHHSATWSTYVAQLHTSNTTGGVSSNTTALIGN